MTEPDWEPLVTGDQDEEAIRALARLAGNFGDTNAGATARTSGEPLRRPAPRPCEACPYRVDAPSGVWADTEYVKLVAYDKITAEQPAGLFQCHVTTAQDPKARVCAGWAAVHRRNPRGHELMALRLAEAFGAMRPDDLYATATYRTPVELWTSGEAAAAHGMAEIEHPSLKATLMIDKISSKRPDVVPPPGWAGRDAGGLFDPSDEDEEDDNLVWPDGEDPTGGVRD